jgi:hypothetical protein
VRARPGHTPRSSGIYKATPSRRVMQESIRAFVA